MPHRILPSVLLTLALCAGCETTGDGDDSNRDRERASPPPTTSPTPPSRPARDEQDEAPVNADSLRSVQPDTRILSILHAKNEEEVRLGRLAIRRGDSAAVKRYAEMLVRDHMNNDREVRSTADRLGINLLDASQVKQMLDQEKGQAPSPDRPRPDETDPIAALEILEGAEFDRRFVELMTQGHEELITIVEQAQRTVTREDVRSLLSRALPRLRQHLAEAQAISADPLRPPNLDNSNVPGSNEDRPGGG